MDNDRQKMSPSYRLAVQDVEFLLQRSELRGLRFALEFQKVDLILNDWGVRSTVVVFGSARALSPEALADLEKRAAGAADRQGVERKARWLPYYEEARRFARIVSQEGGALLDGQDKRDNVIATGGGPGIMEAANRGAAEAGAPSIGFNITLPAEQEPNSYSTPELTFRFHYFAMRKMHLAMRASALAVFPGGFGTFDELFEILTLQQTMKSQPIPVVLIGREYWRRVVDFQAMVDFGVIDADELALFEVVDTAEEAWAYLKSRGLRLRGKAGS
ncbi:MAG TPA: LOG family protein [Dongiaceae bacterium]|jgi:uncharacterized protein (TIGR00730 family)|nr:LOG family protein [Dongiaceae bacterium]